MGSAYGNPFFLGILLMEGTFRNVERSFKQMQSNMQEFQMKQNQKFIINWQKIQSDVDQVRKSILPTSLEKLLDQVNSEIEVNKNDETQLASLYLQRAMIFYETKKYKEAKDDLLHKPKKSFVYFFMYGLVFDALHDYSQAAVGYEKAIELYDYSNPDEEQMAVKLKKQLEKPDTWSGFLTLKEKMEKMKEDLQKGLKRVPFLQQSENLQQRRVLVPLEDLYNMCGISYFQNAEYDRAIKKFNKAVMFGKLSNSSRVGMYFYNQGLAHYFRHEIDKALESFTSALEHGCKSAEVYKMRAMMHRRKSLLSQALQDEEQARKIDPKSKFVSLFHYRLLSDDLVITIFEYLPSSDLARVSRTCSYWNKLVDSPHIWENRPIFLWCPRPRKDKGLGKIFKNRKSAEPVDPFPIMKSILQQPKLRKCKILIIPEAACFYSRPCDPETYISPDMLTSQGYISILKYVATNFNHITELVIGYGNPLAYSMKTFPSIPATLEALGMIVNNCKSLKMLALTNCCEQEFYNLPVPSNIKYKLVWETNKLFVNKRYRLFEDEFLDIEG